MFNYIYLSIHTLAMRNRPNPKSPHIEPEAVVRIGLEILDAEGLEQCHPASNRIQARRSGTCPVLAFQGQVGHHRRHGPGHPEGWWHRGSRLTGRQERLGGVVDPDSTFLAPDFALASGRGSHRCGGVVPLEGNGEAQNHIDSGPERGRVRPSSCEPGRRNRYRLCVGICDRRTGQYPRTKPIDLSLAMSVTSRSEIDPEWKFVEEVMDERKKLRRRECSIGDFRR